MSADTITVHEEQRSAIVRYPKPKGGSFKVKFVQKPNPIGFHARLPGDRKQRV